MKADEFAVARYWGQASRIIALGLLFLSSVQFLAATIVLGTLGKTEADKLISAGCTLFAGVAFALGLAFRRVGAPTWKHKLAVALVALPAALTVIMR
jgi:hypothetical protein